MRAKHAQILLVAVCVACLSGSRTVGGTSAVPSGSPSGVTSPPLVSGVEYLIEASGTYSGYPGVTEDAEWACIPWMYGGGWVEYPDLDQGYPAAWADLLINSQGYDWMGTSDGVNFAPHVYSPSHVYQLYFLGTGDPINLAVLDNNYSDNTGSLQVSIEPVPEPATLSLLALGGLLFLGRRNKNA